MDYLQTKSLISEKPYGRDQVEVFKTLVKNAAWFEKHPITIDTACRVLDGRKRLQAAIEVGLLTVPCTVESKPGDYFEQLTIVKRHGASPEEQGRIICSVIEKNSPSLRVTHVADALGVTVAWVLERAKKWKDSSDYRSAVKHMDQETFKRKYLNIQQGECKTCGTTVDDHVLAQKDGACGGCYVDKAGWVRVGAIAQCPKCKRVAEGTASWAIAHNQQCNFVPRTECGVCKQWVPLAETQNGNCLKHAALFAYRAPEEPKVGDIVDGDCSECGELAPVTIMPDGRRLCKACPRTKATPAERGKVPCIAPACKTWIKKPEAIGSNAFGPRFKPGVHFCKKHKKDTIDGYPMVDRDGDPIWVSAGFVVCKMSQMTESHLTASLAYIANAAMNRAKLSDVEWEKLVGERYPLLVAEAKKRDEKLKCRCADGLLTKQEERIDGDANAVVKVSITTFCTCAKGKMRAQAADISKDFEEGAAHDGVVLQKRYVIALVASIIVAQISRMPWLTADLVRYVLEALKLQ